MLLKFTVKAVKGSSVKQIEALQKKLSDAARLNAVVGRSFEKTLRNHFRKQNRRPNKRGWRKQGVWNKIAADSGYYGKLKARGFVCNGKKIPAFRIMFLSSFAGDNDYIVSLDPSEVIGRGGVGTYLKKIRPLLLSASDKSAYDKTIAIENTIGDVGRRGKNCGFERY